MECSVGQQRIQENGRPRHDPSGPTTYPDDFAARLDDFRHQIRGQVAIPAVGASIDVGVRTEAVGEPVTTERALDHLRQERIPVPSLAVVHSSEISAHEFRTSFRGLDPQAVGDWLRVVEASHAAQADELERLRAGWDEMLIAIARMRAAGSDSRGATNARWSSLARQIADGRPDPTLRAADVTAIRDPFAGQIRGLRRTQAALQAAEIQLSRMQHGAALLQRSNERLRSQLIETLVASA